MSAGSHILLGAALFFTAPHRTAPHRTALQAGAELTGLTAVGRKKAGATTMVTPAQFW
jgi:hypothetical protein